MQRAPKISVVVPTYNRSPSLHETLKALSAQTMDADSYEVVVVDDGSTDNTPRTVARFAAEHRTLSVRYERHHKNKSRAAACNTGIRAARGDFVVFTDDDIRPVPCWLAAHVERHQAGNRVVSVTGLVLYPDEWEERSNWVRFANDNYRRNNALARSCSGGLPPNRFAGGNTSLRREVLLAAGPINDGMRRGQDGDLACRLHEMGVPLVYEPRALVYHYGEAIHSIERTLRSFRGYYEADRLAIRQRYPQYFEQYWHWYLEPRNPARDGLLRAVAKVVVRSVARSSMQRAAIRYLRRTDGVSWLYWRLLYQYVMVCEALDGIRASVKTEPVHVA